MAIWNRQDDVPAQSPAFASAGPQIPQERTVPPTPEPQATSAYISRPTHFQGEIHSQEDLVIDGEMRGRLHLPDKTLVVGPHGRVHAEVEAREVIVHGQLHGDVTARERMEIKQSGSVEGNLKVTRIAIEDGAQFRGKVELATSPKTMAHAAAADAPAFPAATGSGVYQTSLLPK